MTKLADEIMFVFGFAGIGGTSAAVEAAGSFLQVKLPAEMVAEFIDFGDYNTPEKMQAKYKENPVNYIREVCRMHPPVTSCNDVLKDGAARCVCVCVPVWRAGWLGAGGWLSDLVVGWLCVGLGGWASGGRVSGRRAVGRMRAAGRRALFRCWCPKKERSADWQTVSFPTQHTAWTCGVIELSCISGQTFLRGGRAKDFLQHPR